METDRTGKIEITRVIYYTVSDNINYVLPANKTMTIFADKITVAQMHNELPDTMISSNESPHRKDDESAHP